MTKDQEKQYKPSEELKKAVEDLRGKKFRLDCGHHVTFNHHLANDITIRNGKELTIICSLCGY
jgi:hypothetical protein